MNTIHTKLVVRVGGVLFILLKFDQILFSFWDMVSRWFIALEKQILLRVIKLETSCGGMLLTSRLVEACYCCFAWNSVLSHDNYVTLFQDHGTGALVISSLLDFLTFALCAPYSETTEGQQFDMLLEMVASNGRTLFKLFQVRACYFFYQITAPLREPLRVWAQFGFKIMKVFFYSNVEKWIQPMLSY